MVSDREVLSVRESGSVVKCFMCERRKVGDKNVLNGGVSGWLVVSKCEGDWMGCKCVLYDIYTRPKSNFKLVLFS